MRMNKTQGKIHLYTGNGKGKTTAAIGLAIRSAGAGKYVYIAQFVKGMPYSELEVLNQLHNIKIEQFGLDCFIKNKPTSEDIAAAQKGIIRIREYINENNLDILIMDEVCIALHYKLFELKDIQDILNKTVSGLEIVLTGRYATCELYEKADLVTEMKEIKHYYNFGTDARKGIEY